jgi:hypothetical protein
MFTNQLALISQSPDVTFAEAAKISAALQKQITRDYSPIWKVPATIDSFATLDDIPTGYWPIIIMDDIGFAGAAGIHLDSNNQPYALVQAGANTPLTCSHEALEMLTDPFGNRVVASDSIKPGQGRVNYLVEVCDPSEALKYGYSVNGMLLSDFYTPSYFNPVHNSGVQYSFTGAIKAPKQILPGGYLSWMIPETSVWWQGVYFGNKLTFVNKGVLSNDKKSWREVIDSNSFDQLKPLIGKKLSTSKLKSKAKASLFANAVMATASTGRGDQLRLDIKTLLQSLKTK